MSMEEEEAEEKETDNKKKIEVVTGDGSDLNISPVYDHIHSDNPSYNKNTKKENIVIPKGSSDKK